MIRSLSIVHPITEARWTLRFNPDGSVTVTEPFGCETHIDPCDERHADDSLGTEATP